MKKYLGKASEKALIISQALDSITPVEVVSAYYPYNSGGDDFRNLLTQEHNFLSHTALPDKSFIARTSLELHPIVQELINDYGLDSRFYQCRTTQQTSNGILAIDSIDNASFVFINQRKLLALNSESDLTGGDGTQFIFKSVDYQLSGRAVVKGEVKNLFAAVFDFVAS